jgi:hypothetical protein
MTPPPASDSDPFPLPFAALTDRGGEELRPGWYGRATSDSVAATLPPEVFAAVREHATAAAGQLAAGEYAGAVAALDAALRLLPQPRQSWVAAAWLLAAVGECHFRQRSFAKASTALRDATRCPGATGSPRLHLRLGQVAFELGRPELAAQEFALADAAGGTAVFEGEDPKYLASPGRSAAPVETTDAPPVRLAYSAASAPAAAAATRPATLAAAVIVLAINAASVAIAVQLVVGHWREYMASRGWWTLAPVVWVVATGVVLAAQLSLSVLPSVIVSRRHNLPAWLRRAVLLPALAGAAIAVLGLVSIFAYDAVRPPAEHRGP